MSEILHEDGPQQAEMYSYVSPEERVSENHWTY
jgi:hypothetical protein